MFMEVIRKENSMEEIRIQYIGECEGNGEELWKEVGKENYFSREYRTCGRWCFLSGIEEQQNEGRIPEEMVLVICGSDGQAFFQGRHKEAAEKVILFSVTCKNAWERIREDYPEVCRNEGTRYWWLGTFFTEEIRERLKGEWCSKDNFIYNWNDFVEDEVIYSFKWLDIDCAVHRTRKKSRYSEAEWYTYWSGEEKGKDGRCKVGCHIGWSPVHPGSEMALRCRQGIFTIQECESGYDYTFTDQKYEIIDGGQLDSFEYTIYESAIQLLTEENWDEGCTRIDYENTEEMIRKAEERKVETALRKRHGLSYAERNLLY